MEQLQGLDSLFIHHETASAPLHVLAVMQVNRKESKHEISAETFRNLVAARIEQFDALCKKLIEPPVPLAPPLWVRAKPDLRIHIRELSLGSNGLAKDFNTFVGEYMSIPLDRALPLWEFLIVHEPNSEISYLIAKGHHALLDGIAGFELMANIFDANADGADKDLDDANGEIQIVNEDPDWTTHIGASLIAQPFEWATSSLNIARKVLGFAKMVVDSEQRKAFTFPWQAPSWPENRALTSDRDLSAAVITRDDVKKIRRHYRVSFHDVLGLITARAMRKLLIERNELPKTPLVVVSPVSVRRKRAVGGNELGVMFAELPTHLDDIQEEADFMSTSFSNAKDQLSELGSDTLGEISRVAPWTALGKIWNLYSNSQISNMHAPIANIMLSSMPGPSFAMYCAGAKVETAIPYGPIFDGTLLNITAISYLDKVNLGIVTNPQTIDFGDSLAREIEKVCDEIIKTIENS